MNWSTILSGLSFLCLLTSAGTVDVQTKYGTVRGQTHRLHNDIEVNSFLGVPFAKPPIGDLRFEKPQEPDNWNEVFEANSLGDACNGILPMIWLTQPLWLNMSENCLHLNIYTPTDQSRGPYPVMLWIHGGGYQGGANFQYPGYYLASRDVIIVTTNYRQEIFGYLTTGDSVVPGNMGMWDIIQALRFVQENILEFGGDRDRVTIFGESAGATSVGLMLVSPHARDLFNQAILQSGNELAPWAVAHPDAHPENFTRSLATELSCPTEDSQQMIDCLRTIDADELRNARYNCTPGYSCNMRPIVDGPGGFLPDTPYKLRQSGQYKRCTIINGFAKEDGSLFLVPYAIVMGFDRGVNRTQFNELIEDLVRSNAVSFAHRAEDVYEAIKYFYSPWPNIEDPIKNREELVKLATDWNFAASADNQLKMHVDENDAYSYVYAYSTKTVDNSIIPDWLGATHVVDVTYVFGYPLNQLNPGIVEESLVIDFVPFDQEDIDYAEFTMDLWTNFAKFGNPTPSPVRAPNNNTDVTWHKYTHGNYSSLMIDRLIENRLNYRQKEFAFFNSYLTWMVGLDSITSIAQGLYDGLFEMLKQFKTWKSD